MDRREEFVTRRKLVVKINIGTYRNADEFFLGLVTTCQAELERAGLAVRGSAKALSDCQERFAKSSITFKPAMETYFELIGSDRINVIFFIDEFDEARRVFRDSPAEFQQLRELP